MAQPYCFCIQNNIAIEICFSSTYQLEMVYQLKMKLITMSWKVYLMKLMKVFNLNKKNNYSQNRPRMKKVSWII